MSHVFRMGLLLAAAAAFHAPVEAADDRARVTALADRFVESYRTSFPISHAFSGLPDTIDDGVDINAPADIEAWRTALQGMSAELGSIDASRFADQPEWVTWQFLQQALKQDSATAVCRNELWSVSPLGWQSAFPQLAGIQPVATAEQRAQALVRWRRIAAYVDQEVLNLKQGQQLGYSASQAATRSTLAQIDELLAGAPEKSPFMSAAERAGDAAFTTAWGALIADTVWPALVRYRDFLRDDYLAKARAVVSIETHPRGRECYRGLVFATVTIDADPVALFDIAVAQVERERAIALQIGRRLYGDKARDWNTLADHIRSLPDARFATAEEVRDFTRRTYERAHAAAAKMVLKPPVAPVKLEPFPEFQQATAPGGQYMPAADDGSRVATYFYRNVPKDLYRASLQNVILHETLPGHHLQIALLAEHGRTGNHPIARLLYFSGPGEGWATYAEDFANEIGLYESEVDYIGRQMGSITPMMVTDLGLQVKGWTPEQAASYLAEAMPLRPPERAAESVALMSSIPGFVLAYPAGGIEWQRMRKRAQTALGEKFDVRAFHQLLLEDGMLPFAALDAKLERWIAAGGR